MIKFIYYAINVVINIYCNVVLLFKNEMCPLPEIICSSIGLNTDSSIWVNGLENRSTYALLKSPVKYKRYIMQLLTRK